MDARAFRLENLTAWKDTAEVSDILATYAKASLGSVQAASIMEMVTVTRKAIAVFDKRASYFPDKKKVKIIYAYYAMSLLFSLSCFGLAAWLISEYYNQDRRKYKNNFGIATAVVFFLDSGALLCSTITLLVLSNRNFGVAMKKQIRILRFFIAVFLIAYVLRTI